MRLLFRHQQTVKSDERGSLLLLLIITLPFLIIVTVYYTHLALTSFQTSHSDQMHTEAQLAADAGADYAVEQFDANNAWTGTTGQMTVHSDSRIHTTFAASISGDSNTKTVAVTGRSFVGSATTAASTVSIDVDLRPVEQGNYSIVTGAGGLVLKNNAKITTGNIFINGSLTMSNSSQIGLGVLGIGLLPIPVQVADQICPVPADATYPQVCTNSSHPPITMSNSSHIYGKVIANNQTDGSHMSSPGLVSGTVTPSSLPTYDRAGQKAAVTHTMTGAAASCTSSLGGSVIWPANTKIIGDVTISGGLLPCVVTVQGNVWVTGSITLKNNGSIKPAESVGGTMPVIMVDGSSGVTFNNTSSAGINLSLTGLEFITFYCGVGCNEDNPVTGTALAASQTIPTISMNNASLAVNSVFYAYWSQINLANSGQVGAVVGQNIVLSNTASISLGGTASVGTTTWVIKGYRRQF
ncbi:MAG TPA: hypothetical protein VG992_03315 [Candidatus Saccharimonadales bacterium]|nr:hypothetical protein [Candidatus Saccharimonadales bacterium]